ncbi:hypothetical protein Q6A87_05210 [Aliarcobacter skirrowii]|uniref:hypothetical protein n=1 Tax=Aliarcobacter skirrowii TaxID=28200 RepID=UPI0029B4AF96|nr:hypothetical protein [Aliarcobacter skirrowii]MDX4067242.1 hypothetical protein [Aliarcobacter skirrowii]
MNRNKLFLFDEYDIKKFIKENKKVIAYGNGSFYEKVKIILKKYNFNFFDILYTENYKIVSASKKKYEEIIKDSTILICSTYHEDIFKIIETHKIQPKDIKLAILSSNYSILPSILENSKQVTNFNTLAIKYGQFDSILNWECVNADKNNIPWYTYPTIEYLNNLDFSNKRILEFGSGSSSIFWAKKSLEVISIEHNKEWYEKVNQNIKKNQKILLVEDNDNYENSIKKLNKKFDVIVIDGIRRYQCAGIVIEYINTLNERESEYMIILDNSDWYKNTAKLLRDKLDLIEIDFHGFGPINNYTWTTSIFLSRNFNFKPIDDIQPHFSIDAIKELRD